MSSPARLRVDLGARGYDVLVGSGLLAAAGTHLRPVLGDSGVVVVTDATVAKLHLPTLARALDEAGIAHETVVLPPGEASKSFAGIADLVDRLLTLGIDRGSTLVALGGGVIGDLAGFAASIVLRGIDVVQAPTTLLAQADSALGGKTGINVAQGKNLVGSFHQPRLVLADTAVLDSLPRRELVAGYAEVVKYGLIGDAGFFAWLEAHGDEALAEDGAARRRAVVTAVEAKAKVVAADEREAGPRALLNLGHTFGHALEAATGFGSVLMHGEAVAMGMRMAFDLSARLDLCPDADVARLDAHLAAVGLPTSPAAAGLDLDADALIAHMRHDKKVRAGKLVFVLVRGIGEAFVTSDVPEAALAATLAAATGSRRQPDIG